MKIASWNVNSVNARLEHVLRWLKLAKPDVLALQETKSIDDNFPQKELEAAGYHVVKSGQKSYNGVAIIARAPPTDIVTDITELADPQRRVMFATICGVRIMNIYVPNGASVGSDKYDYKLNWLSYLTADIKNALAQYPATVVLGDFNIAPADIDVYDAQRWQGRILCSDPERAALQQIVDYGMIDVFRKLNPEEQQFSWWDYRQAAFRRNMGLRIDLILASFAVAGRAVSCTIDREPRRWERPSDHAPVVLDITDEN